MPFIVDAETAISEEASASFDQPIPAGHQANDVLIAIVTQDGGGTTIAATGWTEVGTQAANQAQRTAVFWKLAASSSEADFSATGANDDWVVTLIVVRGANTTAPFHKNDRTNSADSSTAYLDSGTVTTTENNCLIIHAWGFDQVYKLIISDPNELVVLGKAVSLGCSQIVGYRNQITAGATPVLRALCEVATEGGVAITLAISDANPSDPQMGPDSREAYAVFKRYGGITSAATSTAAFIRHDGVTWDGATSLAATTIDGTGVINIATFAETNAVLSESPWGAFTGLSCTGSAIDNDGRWVGNSHACSSTDMRGKIFALQIQLNVVTPSRFGPKGVIVVFQDGSGNWVAHRVSRRAGMAGSVIYSTFVDLEGYTPLDSSGTMDWSNVVRVGYLLHKRTTATAVMILYIKHAALLSHSTLVDGSAAAPCNPAFGDRLLNGWGGYLLSPLQGLGQALWKSRLRYGDGSRKTYVGSSATSLEFPQAAGLSIRRRFWRVPVSSAAAGLVVRASANDTINMTNCLHVTDTKQAFLIDPTSSASATYNFSGSVNIGWEVTNGVAGVVFNSATFRTCNGIFLTGGGMDGCTIRDSATSPAVTADDPSDIVDCRFISAGTGHAIELTTPGSYDFDGNTFSGYGADGTTDAAIYNNSGGLVTLTINGGGDVPTVRNGAGASTTILTSQVSFTVTVADEAGDPVENARVYARAADGTGSLPFEEACTVTRAASNAVVAHTAHGLVTGDYVRMTGVGDDAYNGVFQVTRVDDNEYTYPVSGTPPASPGGSPLATGVLLYGLTNAGGQITVSRSYSGAQPMFVRVRGDTAPTVYDTSTATGTISITAGLSLNVTLISDE